ncbi:DTW domain-containing protein [Bdellovibrio bacteriovorus]|uniref:tRNA-uridine aminocarboxypropyltransferase n=1 Tax=Bdellovibrio bacteriovorus TaxID=959 RepID=UPI0021CE0A27|nr:tRNA-uridine aminocarboxypropyltransferase [Bdellovibrio bacteriovorus]UXR65960.1 DTW domain-containing protein [Bdellovibrio bacteriovorus]
MELKNYHDQTVYRQHCPVCIQPQTGCYCQHIKPFDPCISFVILIHPIELRRRIATGRMSHLCLQHSYLISGQDYSSHEIVNQLINDPERHCVILYPGSDSLNLSLMPAGRRDGLAPLGKKLTVFVIDGTWATAKKMMRESQNLGSLPQICFSPEKPSAFRVRKQPSDFCYSTIEAIHQTIELLGDSRGFNTALRQHDNLLQVFDVLVERQLDYLKTSEEKNGAFNSRREGKRPAQTLTLENERDA